MEYSWMFWYSGMFLVNYENIILLDMDVSCIIMALSDQRWGTQVLIIDFSIRDITDLKKNVLDKWIPFIFGRCLYSRAAETPAKYEWHNQ